VRKAVREYLEVGPLSGFTKLILGEKGPMTPSAVYRLLQKYADAAGVHISPHMLRYTFATRLLREARADLMTVKELLGHQEINATAIYTQPGMQDMAEAVENL